MFYTYPMTYCLTASSCCTVIHYTILCYAKPSYCILFQLMLSYTILPFTPLYPLSYLYFTPLTTLNLFTPRPPLGTSMQRVCSSTSAVSPWATLSLTVRQNKTNWRERSEWCMSELYRIVSYLSICLASFILFFLHYIV